MDLAHHHSAWRVQDESYSSEVLKVVSWSLFNLDLDLDADIALIYISELNKDQRIKNKIELAEVLKFTCEIKIIFELTTAVMEKAFAEVVYNRDEQAIMLWEAMHKSSASA